MNGLISDVGELRCCREHLTSLCVEPVVVLMRELRADLFFGVSVKSIVSLLPGRGIRRLSLA